jgi:hypothetical protein
MSARLLAVCLALYAAGSVKRGDDVITYVLLGGIVVMLALDWAMEAYDAKRRNRGV